MIGKNVLVLGGTSAITRALAARMLSCGAVLHLAGRDLFELERVACDLSIRYQSKVTWSAFEADDYASHAGFLDKVVGDMGRVDVAVIAAGDLGSQEESERDFEKGRRLISVNFTGMASILTHLANYMEARKSGAIIAISSVAGDRGRRSNYFYASAKGGLSLFLQGLRARLAPLAIPVLTVKPGFVDTKMVFGKPGLLLVASPGTVARDILKAYRRRKDVIYTPWFWRPVMCGFRLVPEWLFKRLPV